MKALAIVALLGCVGCASSKPEADILSSRVHLPMKVMHFDRFESTPTETVAEKVACLETAVRKQCPSLKAFPVYLSPSVAVMKVEGWEQEKGVMDLLPLMEADVRSALKLFCDVADLRYEEVEGRVLIDTWHGEHREPPKAAAKPPPIQQH